MLANFLYVENGPQLPIHQQLYQDGQRKQRRQKQLQLQKEINALREELLSIEEQQSQVSTTRNFYEYSVSWKQKVQQKNFEQNYQDNQTTSTISKVSYIPPNYVSPIDGWKEHAQNYEKRRATKSEHSICQPQINQRSKELEYHEPIEERLIKKGQERDQKLQLAMQWEKFYENVQYNQKQTRPNEDVFERLYNYEKKTVEDEQYSLQLNSLPAEMENKVQKRREQYNLFDPRPDYSLIEEPQRSQLQLSQQQLQQFLLRNQKHPQYQQPVKKEEEETYSFQPELNRNSIEMANKKGLNLLERQQEFLEKRKQKIQSQQIYDFKKPPAEIKVNKQTKPYDLQSLLQKKSSPQNLFQ
ncbi:hypothetical protein pb186bvf_016361 [Paramecium bursaria]